VNTEPKRRISREFFSKRKQGVTLMKVYVTGGNGFLGSRTVEELIRRGHQVRCLLREKSNLDRIQHLPFESHKGDVRNLESLREGTRNCDAIIHMACISSWAQIREQSEHLEEIAIEGTRNVLEAARENGIPRVVYISSSAAINASKTPELFNESSPYTLAGTSLKYSLAKHRAEQVVLDYVRNKGMDIVIVNPAEAYGSSDDGMVTAGNLIEILKDFSVFVCSGGTSVAHVDDIARGITLALEKGKRGERYILGGDNLTVAELAKTIRRIAKKNHQIITLPNAVISHVCRGLEKVGIGSPFPLDVLEYAVLYWFVDSSKAQRELGYSWRPANEIFAEVVQWLFDTKRVA